MEKVVLVGEGTPNFLIGSYTLDELQEYLNYYMEKAQAYEDLLGSDILVFIIKQGENWENKPCTCRIRYGRNFDGRYVWVLDEKVIDGNVVSEIAQLVINVDKIKQLEAEIEVYKKRIEYLENHIKYMPGGPGALDAHEHFLSIVN